MNQSEESAGADTDYSRLTVPYGTLVTYVHGG